MKKYGILTAMSEEADLIIKKYSLKKETSFGKLEIFCNENIALILTGIGKIQATFGTVYLMEKYSPKTMINIGIAGNANTSFINIGDVLLVNKIYQHDMFLPFEGNHLDYAKKEIILNSYKISNFNEKIINFKLHAKSICLTGDQFISDNNIIKNLNKKYAGDCVEMEAFAIASIAREYNRLDSLVIIKGISDGANNEAINEHMSNLELAMNNSIKILEHIIK